MTANSNPWAGIPAGASSQLARRRVDADSDLALFWFRDERGCPGLLIEISKYISQASLREARISIRDISIDVIQVVEENIHAITIKLEDPQNQDVFVKLCLDLIEHAKTTEDGKNTFYIICRRLKKWQSLLSGATRNLLSDNEVQGLYAELYFIAEMLESDATRESTLIQGWKGPERIQHDFILSDTAIEIKSLAGDQRRKVRITSEDQLDTHLEKLYLRVYFLSEVKNSGESLNGLTRRIRNQLVHRANSELFELKLESARYIDIPDYDTPLFRVKACHTYLIQDGFPRITRNMLPDGVESVGYDLVLAGVERFRVDDEDMIE